jgi:hypothetical protein
MTRPNIKTWDIARVEQLRTLLSFESWNIHGERFAAIPETLRITDQRVGCKSCGCPLDPGVEVIRVLAYNGYESRREPKTMAYIHRENCWRDGFVQTVQLDGRLGIMRVRANNRTYDVSYDLNKAALNDPEKPLSELGDYPTGNVEPVSVTVPFLFLKDTGIRTPADLKRHEREESKIRAKALKERAEQKARAAYLNPDAKPYGRKVKSYDVSSDG